MKVFKVYSDINNTKIIEANSYKQAAINYCNKFSINDNIGISVVEKGFKNRKNVMWYKTSELFPERIQIRSGNKDFDESKLDSYSLKLFNQIKQYSPGWLNNIFNCEVSEYESESGFSITILNSYQDFHPIEISIADGDGLMLTFAWSWMDWYEIKNYVNAGWTEFNRNFELVYKTIKQLVNEIIDEKIISCNARYTEGIGTVNGIFLTEDEFNRTKDQDTLLQAVSWKGKYNYSKYE